MPRIRPLLSALSLLALSCSMQASQADEVNTAVADEAPWRGAMLSAEQVIPSRLSQLKSEGYRTIALQLTGGADRPVETRAIDRIRSAQLELGYWIEVARSPELADKHPRWMASLQGHDEWRRLFSDPPKPAENEVVKNYPWVPILNREPFDGQFSRVKRILADRPQAQTLFLNDLQGSPSACGCGNQLCRWTSDYGDLRTSTPIGNEAPAQFVAKVQSLVANTRVVPVWTTECEEHDGANDGHCAGVGCFKGICWRAYTKQLMAVANNSAQIGVLLPYQAFDRDLPVYGEDAGWIQHATKTFQKMPPQHQGTAIDSSRLIAVLQGWDVTEDQIQQQSNVAAKANLGGIVVAFAKIEQSWLPKLLTLDP